MKNFVKIINILDISGSMKSIIDSSISGFNSFIEEQKTIEGDAVVSTVLFNHKYQILYEDKDLKNCELLNKDIYVPDGRTALYDTIGFIINKEIDKLGSTSVEERPEKTLCVVLTDGYENASHEYDSIKIKTLIEEMKKDFSWEFIFLGANIDAFSESSKIGVTFGNTFNFAATDDGTKDAYQAVNYAATTYRMSKSTKLDNVMQDYEKNKNKI